MTPRGGTSVRFGLAIAAASTIVVVLVAFSFAIHWKTRDALHDALRTVALENLERVALIAADEDDDFEELVDELRKESGLDHFLVAVEGLPVAASDEWLRDELPTTFEPAAEVGAIRRRVGQDEFLVATRRATYAGRPAYVAVAIDTAVVASNLAGLRWTLFTLLPVAALAALGIGWWLAGRLLAPVHSFVAAIERIDPDRLDQRLPVGTRGSEFDRIAEAFNRALDRVRDAFERLRKFTADASHELRTPLTAIRAVGEVALRDGDDPVRCRDAIGSMLEETDRLAQLVDRLLKLTRADAGAYRARFVEADLARVLRDAADLFGPLAEEQGVALEVACAGSLVRGADVDLLREALINLIDNALRHTARGGRVTLTGARSAAGDELTVTDTGCGIAPEHHSRIFERFYRAEGPISDGVTRAGTGLGLAIVRWIAELHGGTVGVDSAIGRGSRFRIVLPLAPHAAVRQP